MPGSVSDAYDPEWGTAANADEIRDALAAVYGEVNDVLDNRPPIYILNLVRAHMTTPITATLTERQWRLIRFALERTGESL